MRRAPLLAAALLAASLASPSARADEARAQALFTEGRAALEKGDYPTACARFNESLGLVQRASTLLNLAQCEMSLGKLKSSAAHWKAGIALLPAGDERLTISRERAAEVEGRLSHLTVTLSAPAPAGARVEIDGAAVPLGELAGVPLDPGRHTVVLLVPGSAEQRSSVDLSERESKTVTVAVAVAATAAPATPPPSGGSSGGSGLRTAGFALLGVGAVGAVVAGITGGVLVSKNSSINSHCPVVNGQHACDPTGTDLIAGTKPLMVVNAIGWGAGIAGVAAGVVLVVVSGKAPAATPPTGSALPTLSPIALPGGGGVWLSKRF